MRKFSMFVDSVSSYLKEDRTILWAPRAVGDLWYDVNEKPHQGVMVHGDHTNLSGTVIIVEETGEDWGGEFETGIEPVWRIVEDGEVT